MFFVIFYNFGKSSPLKKSLAHKLLNSSILDISAAIKCFGISYIKIRAKENCHNAVFLYTLSSYFLSSLVMPAGPKRRKVQSIFIQKSF